MDNTAGGYFRPRRTIQLNWYPNRTKRPNEFYEFKVEYGAVTDKGNGAFTPETIYVARLIGNPY